MMMTGKAKIIQMTRRHDSEAEKIFIVNVFGQEGIYYFKNQINSNLGAE